MCVALEFFLLLWERKNISFLVQFLFLCWWCINLQIGGTQIALKFSFRYSGRYMPEQFVPLILFLFWSNLFEWWGCPLEAQKAKNNIENEQRWCPCCFIMFERWSLALEVGSDQFAPHGGKIASLSSSFHALLFILHLSYFFACSTQVYTMRNS